MTKILIGADPEFWVVKDGKPVSAYGLVDGTKEKPQPLTHGAVQVDGMALEVNINPAETWREFRRNLVSVMSEVRQLIPEEYDFSFEPVALFGKDYIQSQPEEAKELGCQPDFCAYTGEANDTPDAGKGFRTAAGHFHIGWCDGVDIELPAHVEACRTITRELDATLGVLTQLWDRDRTRQELYGNRGAFRPKPYGVEYRVPSCAWLKDLAIAKTCFYIIKNVVNSAMNPNRGRFCTGGTYTDVRYGANFGANRRSISRAFRPILTNTGLREEDLLKDLDIYPKMHVMNKNDSSYRDFRKYIGVKTDENLDKVSRGKKPESIPALEGQTWWTGGFHPARNGLRMSAREVQARANEQERAQRERAREAWAVWERSAERQSQLVRAEDIIRRVRERERQADRAEQALEEMMRIAEDGNG